MYPEMLEGPNMQAGNDSHAYTGSQPKIESYLAIYSRRWTRLKQEVGAGKPQLAIVRFSRGPR